DEGVALAARLHAVDLGDVRVVELGEQLRLALEAREALGIGDEAGGQDFDRDVAFELGIVGAIDLAHPAFAELGGDLVGTEADAGGERHGGALSLGFRAAPAAGSSVISQMSDSSARSIQVIQRPSRVVERSPTR